MTKPTEIQADALRQMIAHGGRLLCEPGGFWTYPEAPRVQRWEGPLGRAPHTVEAPVWWVSVQTVRAMERNGWVVRAGVQEEWKDERLVTSLGREAVA